MLRIIPTIGVVTTLLTLGSSAGTRIYRDAILADQPLAYWEFDAVAGGGSLLPAGSNCTYFKGRSEPPADWTDPLFNDSTWLSGPTGIGYGDNDDATELLDMQGNYASVFVRIPFHLDDPAVVENLFLSIRYDDAFVAYLNGHEVDRSNILGTPPAHNIGANEANGNVDAPGPDLFNITEHLGRLVSGRNVLAVQVHNHTSNSSDLSMNPALLTFQDTPALDSSGNGYDGNSAGLVGYGVASFHENLGTAIQLNGSNAYIEVPALGTFPQSTIEAWVNMDAVEPPPGCCTSVFSTGTFGGGNHHLNIRWTLDIEQSIAGGGPNTVITPQNTIQLGTWHHIVSTYDSTTGGTAIIYVDGFQVAFGGHFATPVPSFTAAQIGAWGGTRLFNGRIDEVAIYDSALSPDQIVAHYQAATIEELVVTDVGFDPASRLLSFSWLSESDEYYLVEYSRDLTNWIELDSGFFSGGATTTYPFVVPAGFEQVFMRATRY